MAERIATALAEAMAALPKELIIFVVSMLPIVELRGGLIIAPILGIPMPCGKYPSDPFCTVVHYTDIFLA